MTRLLMYLLPGILLDIALLLVNGFVTSQELLKTNWYDNLMNMIYISAIIVPCVIYYIKMPPGTNTKP